MSESSQGTADENAYQSLISLGVEQGVVLNESSASDVAEGRIVRLALAEGSGDTSDEMGINEVPEGRIVRLALAEGVGEEADEAGVGEVTEGRVVRLALTDGADGQQIIQEVPADQIAQTATVNQDSSLVQQHIQIQPLGQEIPQGEVITLTLEEAQQLLQQQIVAGEGVEGMQPGIYQILTSGVTQPAEGQMLIAPGEGISLLQPGTTEAVSGFEGQSTGSHLHTTHENLQPQPAQINGSAGVVNNGVSNQPENTIHIDFHVNQPETVTHVQPSIVNPAQPSIIGNTGQLQIVPTSTVSTPGLVPLGMSTPINVQTTASNIGAQQVIIKQTQTVVDSQDTEPLTEEKKLLLENYNLKPVLTLKEENTPTSDPGQGHPTPSKQGEVCPDPGKLPDLSKPIEVKEETEVIVKGKKCMLKVDPDSGKLTAYPLLPPAGTKKRGRPRKSEQEKKEALEAKMSSLTPDHTSRAAEGLLELSNTVESGSSGQDGIRRSGRVRKKAKTLDDYEMLEVSSDDDGGLKIEEGTGDEEDVKRLKLEQDYIPPNSILLSLPTSAPIPVKRGRGRPRRYPPPGQATTTQIPTMIIPTSDGQTIMMAPIQGLENLQAFQDQIKNISILPKSLTGAAIAPVTGTPIAPVPESPSTAQILQTDQTSAASLVDGEYPASSGLPLTGDSVESVVTDEGGTTIVIRARPDPQEMDGTNFVDNSVLMQSSEDMTGPEITEESEPPDIAPDFLKSEEETAEEQDTETKEAIDSLQDMSRITVKNGENQPTIIQIPENLLPMFMQKKEPLKLGLKSSEDALEKMKCVKCNFQAYYEQQYQSHIATHVDDIIKCKACNFVTFEKEDLLTHFREVHPKCICNVCDFMAEHGYIIKRHMMRHSVDGCRCDICGKCYKDQYVLKMHIKMVHMPAEVLFECMICAKKFTRKAHLKRHLRIHDPEKPFKCPHCEYRGCEKSDISKHLLIHEEPQHVCEVCGKAFRHVKNKELHLKRHNGQRDYKCGVCDFYGYTFTDIRKHIERKHTDAKTIICDKCGSAFKTDWHLKEHQRLGNCEMFMIEQALAIATSDGSSSKATIQIPTSMSLEGVIDGQQLQINGQNVILDLNMGQYATTKEDQVKLTGDTVTLTEEQLQEAVNQGQIIDSATAENMIMQVNDTGVHAVKLGAVGGVCLTDNEEEEEEEEEETEDDINVLNRNIHSMVSEMSD